MEAGMLLVKDENSGDEDPSFDEELDEEKPESQLDVDVVDDPLVEVNEVEVVVIQVVCPVCKF